MASRREVDRLPTEGELFSLAGWTLFLLLFWGILYICIYI